MLLNEFDKKTINLNIRNYIYKNGKMRKKEKNRKTENQKYEYKIITKIFKTQKYLHLFEFLCINQYIDFSLSELGERTNISRPTLYKILDDFGDLGIIKRKNNRYTYGDSDLARQLSGSFLVIALAVQKKTEITSC